MPLEFIRAKRRLGLVLISPPSSKPEGRKRKRLRVAVSAVRKAGDGDLVILLIRPKKEKKRGGMVPELVLGKGRKRKNRAAISFTSFFRKGEKKEKSRPRTSFRKKAGGEEVTGR